MNKGKLKLICPVCENDFSTSVRNKIYCDNLCRGINSEIRKRIDVNIRKQEMFKSSSLKYDYASDKFAHKGTLKYSTNIL